MPTIVSMYVFVEVSIYFIKRGLGAVDIDYILEVVEEVRDSFALGVGEDIVVVDFGSGCRRKTCLSAGAHGIQDCW